MKKLVILSSLIIILSSIAEGQSKNRKYPFYHYPKINRSISQDNQANLKTDPSVPTLQTIRCLGGSGDEGNFSNFMTQTADGGFITCTYTSSDNGNISGNHGGVDVWIIKYNSTGAIQWKKTYGGTSDDFAGRVIQTTDGGYMLLGFTYSNDGDVTGNHGEGDLWLVKLTTNGNIVWQKCYGGNGDEFAYYGIIQTLDGGYAAICSSASNNGDANGNHGGYDVLVLKLTSNGNIQWTKTYGGSEDEYGNLIVQNSDGSYTISTDTYSTNGNIHGNHGALDTWVARLSSNGNIMWSKCIGGSDEEYNASLIPTKDGNILIGDYAGSHDGDVTGNHGVITNGGDMWLVKLNISNGNFIWTKTLGGSNGVGPRPSLPEYPDDEVALFIYETPSGEFLVAGGSTSSDGDLTVNRGVGDCWVLKLDNTGNLIWQKSFGGSDEDAATAIFPLNNGGFIVAGWTYSNDYDFKNKGQHGEGDIFIVTLSQDNSNVTAVFPSSKSVSENEILQGKAGYELKNFPNPFSQSTTISFSISEPGKVSLKIYDLQGKLITTLADRQMHAGNHQIKWDANNSKLISSGVYLLRMEAESYSETKQLMVVK